MKEASGRDDDPLCRTFAPLIGLPAWCVRKGYGNCLTLEFGGPHLAIREPIVASPGASERVRAALRRRTVIPHGDWHLWIWCCHWRVLSNGTELAGSEASDEQIASAIIELDGQLLAGVEADPTKGTSAFSFDQGGAIQTWPYPDGGGDEQWMLYMKSSEVFSYRGDGRYSLGPVNQSLDDTIWQSLRSDLAT
jgi:hypothetical protein